jgi:hypothetical protein
MRVVLIALVGVLVVLAAEQPLSGKLDALDGMQPTGADAKHMVRTRGYLQRGYWLLLTLVMGCKPGPAAEFCQVYNVASRLAADSGMIQMVVAQALCVCSTCDLTPQLESAKGVVEMLATIQPPPADQCEVLDAIIKAIALIDDAAAERDPTHMKGNLVSGLRKFHGAADMSATCAETRQVRMGWANNGLAHDSDIADIVLMLRDKMEEAGLGSSGSPEQSEREDAEMPEQSQREVTGMIKQSRREVTGTLAQPPRQAATALHMQAVSARHPATIDAPPQVDAGLLATAPVSVPPAATATAQPETRFRGSIWLTMLSWVDETAEIVLAVFLLCLFVLTLGMLCPACSHMVVDLPHGHHRASASTTKRVALDAKFDPHHINAQTGAVLHRDRADDTASLRPKQARPALMRFWKGSRIPTDEEQPPAWPRKRQASAPGQRAKLQWRESTD